MKEEKKESKVLTIHGRMAKIKKELGETKIPKSGHNKYGGFKYHELSDFISIINNLNEKHGVNDFVEIYEVEKECRLTLVNIDNSEDRIVVRTPFREAEMLAKGGAPSNVDAIQRMGSTITYNRRYLYMTAYNIQENDSVDSDKDLTPKDEKKQPKPKAPAKPKKDFQEGGFEKALSSVFEGEVKSELIISQYNLTDEQLNQLEEAEKTIKNK